MCCAVTDQPLNERDAHLHALSNVPEDSRVYKPTIWLIPEYNMQFLLVVSDYFNDFQFPSHIKVRLWWSAGGDNIFRAHLRQFRDGKTGLDAIMHTAPGCNLEERCLTLSPNDPQTADIVYFATPRAVNECESLRRLLSPQAKELIAQEDEDKSLVCGIMDPDGS